MNLDEAISSQFKKRSAKFPHTLQGTDISVFEKDKQVLGIYWEEGHKILSVI